MPLEGPGDGGEERLPVRHRRLDERAALCIGHDRVAHGLGYFARGDALRVELGLLRRFLQGLSDPRSSFVEIRQGRGEGAGDSIGRRPGILAAQLHERRHGGVDHPAHGRAGGARIAAGLGQRGLAEGGVDEKPLHVVLRLRGGGGDGAGEVAVRMALLDHAAHEGLGRGGRCVHAYGREKLRRHRFGIDLGPLGGPLHAAGRWVERIHERLRARALTGLAEIERAEVPHQFGVGLGSRLESKLARLRILHIAQRRPPLRRQVLDGKAARVPSEALQRRIALLVDDRADDARTHGRIGGIGHVAARVEVLEHVELLVALGRVGIVARVGEEIARVGREHFPSVRRLRGETGDPRIAGWNFRAATAKDHGGRALTGHGQGLLAPHGDH